MSKKEKEKKTTSKQGTDDKSHSGEVSNGNEECGLETGGKAWFL